MRSAKKLVLDEGILPPFSGQSLTNPTLDFEIPTLFLLKIQGYTLDVAPSQ